MEDDWDGNIQRHETGVVSDEGSDDEADTNTLPQQVDEWEDETEPLHPPHRQHGEGAND